MKFNKYFWGLYRDSIEGKSLIGAMNPDSDDVTKGIKTLFDYANRNGCNLNIDSIINCISLFADNLDDILIDYFNNDFPSRKSFEKFIEEFEIALIEKPDGKHNARDIIIKQSDYRAKAACIHILSTYLYYVHKFFKPVILQSRFDIFQRNCNIIGVNIPSIPSARDYKSFLMYYYDICLALNEFQKENKLTDEELCACLYGFADKYVEENIQSSLPKPTNVWITGAKGRKDFDSLDSLENNKVWACNERTKRGDIIVIYCNSPRSYVHSIWRANSNGIFNPFDYFHNRIKICDGLKIPPISFNDLKNDEYFSQISFVRRNLQGINGVELSAKDYSELIRMISEKKNISNIPKLYEGEDYNFGEIELEKDVEEKILIPMLERIGYKKNDWVRQLSQKAGRKEKAIPDFVFFPKGDKHFNNAPMIIEAKLDMSTAREQQKAFKQAYSYARTLRASIMGVCDKERLILYTIDKAGHADYGLPIYVNHWKVIFSDTVEGARLNQIIGCEVNKNI